MPSRYRAHVQTGMSWFSGLASVPALIGMGMCRHTLRIPRVSNRYLTKLFLTNSGAATKMDPINGWKWVFRTQLIVNGVICLGFLLIYHVSLVSRSSRTEAVSNSPISMHSPLPEPKLSSPSASGSPLSTGSGTSCCLLAWSPYLWALRGQATRTMAGRTHMPTHVSRLVLSDLGLVSCMNGRVAMTDSSTSMCCRVTILWYSLTCMFSSSQ
jgi:hypothetical protein